MQGSNPAVKEETDEMLSDEDDEQIRNELEDSRYIS